MLVHHALPLISWLLTNNLLPPSTTAVHCGSNVSRVVVDSVCEQFLHNLAINKQSFAPPFSSHAQSHVAAARGGRNG